MLLSMVVYLVGLIGCSRATSYGGLMTARLVHTFSSGVCEALPVQLVSVLINFLEARGIADVVYLSMSLGERYFLP